MPYYPVFLDLRGRKVLVVGGGTVAQRKVETFLEFGGSVFITARELTETLKGHVEEGRIRFAGKEFREDDLQDAWMVVAATDDPDANRRVSECARQRGILVNAVDQPSDCTFIVPSVLRRGDLVIAVSTSGKSPALARRVREQLEQIFGAEYESFLILMGLLREEILSRGLSLEERSEIFRDLVQSDLLERIRSGDWAGAASTLNRITGTTLSPLDMKKTIEVT
ncbi:MAG: bifunctional precorrin-2 dehydrogenase/sirohydrochlorin ferrochelatase [Deltaproteobacteria bacterium]|nr:bifunctional precorrin-2 dehydrogenase/sirohydrochlorin ferrochelatase [Deltaproteobacteria bacterium]